MASAISFLCGGFLLQLLLLDGDSLFAIDITGCVPHQMRIIVWPWQVDTTYSFCVFFLSVVCSCCVRIYLLYARQAKCNRQATQSTRQYIRFDYTQHLKWVEAPRDKNTTIFLAYCQYLILLSYYPFSQIWLWLCCVRAVCVRTLVAVGAAVWVRVYSYGTSAAIATATVYTIHYTDIAFIIRYNISMHISMQLALVVSK